MIPFKLFDNYFLPSPNSLSPPGVAKIVLPALEIWCCSASQTVMDTWTRQMGFPLITVTRSGSYVNATQKRFLLTGDVSNSSDTSEPDSPYGYKWYVPLSYYTNQCTDDVYHVWMNMTDGRLADDTVFEL
ncbi:hypothetical protein PR048_025309 [Dryococelus australis]|uniref:Uncharacterized protein n=1 Tax=Dryococelus australis TaxID=614101 RepID=A0ABQ9GR13_9NEOP|nr:hypothetical protein PR048_025309 [Dryococelus australis]